MSQGYGENSTSNHLCGDFALELDPSLGIPPDVRAEIDGICARLDREVREAGITPARLPKNLTARQAQARIDKILAELGEGLPVRNAQGNLVKRVEAPGPAEKAADPVPPQTPGPLVYRLRCLRPCTVGLGQFARIYHPGDVWSRDSARSEVSRNMIDPTDAKADRIIERFKMEPQRGPDWSVEVVNA